MVHDGLGSGCPPRANAIQWRLMPMHPIGDRVLIARATAVGGPRPAGPMRIGSLPYAAVVLTKWEGLRTRNLSQLFMFMQRLNSK